MPIPTYTPGYPPDGSSLGQTKATIRNNLDGTFQTLAVDHVNNNGQPGSNPAGYHTVIHEVIQTSVDRITDVNQIFSGVPGTLVVDSITTPAIPPNGDTQLYSLTGQGGLSQLTGNSSQTRGYQWIGGVLIQWGRVISTASNNTENFEVTFPRRVFSLTFGMIVTSGSTTNHVGQVYLKGAFATTDAPVSSFNWRQSDLSSDAVGFYYTAIGY